MPATLTLWPARLADGSVPTLYAADGTTLITAAGIIAPDRQYYRDLRDRGRLLDYDPVGTGGTPIGVPDTTEYAATAGNALTADQAAVASALAGLYSAQLDTTVGAAGQFVRCVGRTSLTDGVAQDWRWSQGSTATADGALVRGSGAGRWLAVWDGASFDARWAGVVADCVTGADLRCTGGNATVTRAAGGFTAADVGKRILVRTPSVAGSGTITMTAESHVVTGTGTQFLTEIRDRAWNDAAGGQGQLIWPANALFLEPWSIKEFGSATSMTVNERATYDLTSGGYYLETQLEATIASYVSPTQVTLSVAPSVSSADILYSPGQQFAYGTDNRAALALALTTAIAAGASELLLPPGVIGFYGNNLTFTATGLRIRGAGRGKTILKDLRRASREYATASVFHSAGILTGVSCSFCSFEDFSVDGSVPVIGMKKSMGGSVNIGGGRNGLLWDASSDCAFRRIGAVNGGSRDEFCAAHQGPSARITWDDISGTVNCNASNPAFGGGECEGVQVLNMRVKADFQPLVFGGKSGVISGNELAGYSPPSGRRLVGNSVVVLALDSDTKFYGNTISDSSSPEYGAFPLLIASGSVVDPTVVVDLQSNTLKNIRFGSHLKDCGLVGFSGLTDNTADRGVGTYRFRGNTAANILGSGIGTIGVDTHGGAFVFVDLPFAKRVDAGGNVLNGGLAQGMVTGVRISERTPMDIVDVPVNTLDAGVSQLQVLVKGERVTDGTTKRRTSTVVDLAGSTTFTVHAFFSAREVVDNVNILWDRGRSDGSGLGAHMRVQSGFLVGACGTDFVAVAPPSGFVGREHILTLTLSGTAMAFYCDGVSMGTRTVTYVPQAVENYFGCASVGSGSNNSECPLLAVSGGAYALTAPQVAAHYAACVAKQSLLKHASDQHYWRFTTRGGAVTDVLDEVTGNTAHRVVTATGTGVSRPPLTDLATIVSLS